MANRNAPAGARLVGHLYGSPYNARVRQYVVPASDSTALYIGDFVKMVGDGDVNQVGMLLPEANAAAAGNVLLGVVVGFMPTPDQLNITYRPAYTQRTIFVCDDPNAIFEIQSTGTFASTDIGQNADFVAGSPSTVWGTSGSQLNHASLSASDGQLRILGIYQSVDNELGAYCKVTCFINEHIFKQIAGV